MALAAKVKKPKLKPGPVGKPASAAARRSSVDGDLAAVAGLGRFKSTDPVNHIIEHSRNLFDMMGRANALKMARGLGEKAETLDEGQTGGVSSAGSDKKEGKKKGKGKNPSADKSEDEQPEDEEGNDEPGGEFYRKFSEVAFRNGKMLSSVEDGGALTLMTSCIRHSIVHSPPPKRGEPQETTGATRLNVPASGTAKLIYRKHARNALSLIVDTAQNLTMTLSLYESMAKGEIDNRLGIAEVETAYRTYPFLNIEPEKKMLEQYNEQIRSLPDGDKKRALEYGVNRLNTIIGHKDQMRVDFHQGLRKVMQNAQETAKLFSRAETEDEITRMLYEGGEGGGPPSKGKGKGDGAGPAQAGLDSAEAAGMMGNQNVLNIMNADG